MMKILLKILTLLILLLLQNALNSKKAYAESETAWQFTAGVGVITSQQPWLDANNLNSVGPLLDINYGKWNFFGGGFISYTLLQDDDFAISAGIDYRDEGFGSNLFTQKSNSDNPVFDGYQTPDEELVANINIQWNSFSASIQQDISNTSKGLVIEAGLSLPLYDSGDKFSLSAKVGFRWLSEDYVQHIYGITGEQIDETVGRNEYFASSALNPVLSIQGNYVVSQNWLINTGAEFVKLDDAIFDSPLVGRQEIFQLFVGGIYIF